MVGRTRLQKQAYLLTRCGADFRLPFTYHHYGPYSFKLAAACDAAEANGKINTEQAYGFHKVAYTIYSLDDGFAGPEELGGLSAGCGG